MSTMLRNATAKMAAGIRIGYIPEHFSTPLMFAQKYKFFERHGIENYELIPYPSGSGHMISSLKNDEIDIVVGLTEAFVRGICNGDEEYNLVGTYVESPLCWSITTGIQRDDLQSIEDLKKPGNNRIGVSRIGSGSYVMSFILGLQEKFPHSFDFQVLNNFKNLRQSVNTGDCDAFMWEYFTTKKYYDSGEVKRIGEIYTPWSAFIVASAAKLDTSTVTAFNDAAQDGITYYNDHQEEAISHILANLDYDNERDLREWATRVKFTNNVRKVDWKRNILNTASILEQAGVVDAPRHVTDARLAKFVTAARK
jgi:hypothetical protein